MQLFIERGLRKARRYLLAIYQEGLSKEDDSVVEAMRQIVGVFAELERNMIFRRLRYKGKVVDGSHEAIIDPLTFGQVQAALSRRVKAGREGKARNAL